MNDWRRATNPRWSGNFESQALSALWQDVRGKAQVQLHLNSVRQGNGVLAHVNFSQMFEIEGDPKQFLARHIIVATTVDEKRARVQRDLPRARDERAKRVAQHQGDPIPLEVRIVVDMHAGKSPLTAATASHHQSYAINDEEGPI
jgi:hypothetical protein